MPEETRAPAPGGDAAQRDGQEVEVKVTDRRRFTPDGEPIPEAEPAAETGPVPAGPEAIAEAAAPAAPDPRDLTIAEQAARIDTLTRAYAAQLEEGKAARGRMEREKARVLEAERAGVAQVLLDAVDDLERAVAAAEGATGPLAEGVALTLAALRKKVTELGAERLVVAGQPFDPRLHDAVDLVPVEDPAQDDVVVHEVRAGYRIGDRVLRPARVRVGRLARA